MSYDSRQITRALEELGQPRYRINQVLEWVWQRTISSYGEMTNIPKDVREALAERAPLARPTIIEKQSSRDGTRKYLVEFADGQHVEVVGLPTKDRLTVCASTQIGCAMGCSFCATGMGGLVRNLSATEIADTVALVARDFGRRVSNVVMMGQGEPFANYDETLEALRILNASWGFGIGARHLTVSTCGLLEGIKRFTAEPEQFTLAISLHSARQKTRDQMMPGVSTQPLDKLKDALNEYYEKTGRRPTLEYALIVGVNDTSEEIDALGKFASAIGAHVNLIPLNVWDDDGAGKDTRPLAPTPAAQTADIVTLLRNRYGVEATLRARRGADIDAACGQLRSRRR